MHSRSRITGLLATVAIVASACSGNTASPAATGSGATQPAATTAATQAAEATLTPFSFPPADLRWYCCLGTGQDATQVPVENQVAADFSKKAPGSTLKFEAVTYDQARDTLSTQLGGGNAPDIVGPNGFGGFNAFEGQWLDLAPYITKSNYDLTQFAQSSVDFYKSADGQIGIPFDVYPSVLWYKKDMFTEAGLAEPPHKYGDKYTMPDGSQVEWNYDTLKKIALILTVDKNGKDATQAGFDPKNIVQYGFEPQRDDLRGLAAYWAPGTLVGSDGKTATIPDAWKVAWKYFYDGMWTDHFIMTDAVFQSDKFGGGEYAFFSGNVAMSENFLWTTYGVANAGTDWDLAAIPAYNGVATAPLNADSFAIPKHSKNPDTAFAALTYLLGDASDTLLNIYGGMPARPDKQDAFLEQLGKSEGFPAKVDWQVAKDSLGHADIPNFESPMPQYNKTLDILIKYRTKWTTTPGLNMDAEFAALQAEIQAAWNS
ncbi:MAG TPA: extracellular solute-binding protein [Candidatus Limnocylindrales bacterium]|nr:extracellular solute-binding protein [Candidatus Limnocylindrales bacterium]